MKAIVALIFLLLVNCAPNGTSWDLNEPISLHISTDTPYGEIVKKSITKAILSVGGSISNSGQELEMGKGDDTLEEECKDGRLAFSNTYPYGNIIKLCLKEGSSNLNQDYMDRIIYHEFGHILIGQMEPAHLDCQTGAIMSPSLACQTTTEYTKEDIDFICSSGNTKNGICS